MSGGGDKPAEEGAEGAAEPEEPKVVPELAVVEVNEHITDSGDCGIPETSCNQVAGRSGQLTEGLEVVALPLRVTFHLWRQEPDLDSATPPDLTFVVAIQ